MRSRVPALALALGVWLAASAAGAAGVQHIPQQLYARAVERGSVRVIVELDEPSQSEGTLTAPLAAWRQRRRIAASQQGLETELASTAHRVTHRFRAVPFVALEVGPDALAALAGSMRVLAVQEDRLHSPSLNVSVPLVEAPASHALGLDGAGQAVVILDTGVDAAHPNFAGKIVAEACFASGSPFGSGDCPNGGTKDLSAGAGVPCSYSSSCFHGTHVAGIAAGAGSFSGVAPAAEVISIQVFSQFTGASCNPGSSPCPLSYASDQIAALDHVLTTLSAQFDIAAVNMSLGGTPYSSQSLCDASNPGTKAAIDNLRSAGIATVIAAGNDGLSNMIDEPGCISSAISVGATDDNDAIAGFSNSAAFLSLWAPGVGITAPLYLGSGFASSSGTSMATPHVSGSFAILRQQATGQTVSELLSALQTTGLPIPDTESSTARIRVHPALQQFLPACSDGVDNDEDGLTDWDGGGISAPDPECLGNPLRIREDRLGLHCGLGPEFALLIPVLGLIAHRRRRG